MASAVDDLLKFYTDFKSEFEEFYPQLEAYIAQEIRELPYP
jgi:hypothetical protein